MGVFSLTVMGLGSGPVIGHSTAILFREVPRRNSLESTGRAVKLKSYLPTRSYFSFEDNSLQWIYRANAVMHIH